MALGWTHENPPRWDAEKARILGAAAPGVFDLGDPAPGSLLVGDWWRAEQDGVVVGYGWMDVSWGYAPVLLAVAPEARAHGVGAFILDRLADEAHERGLAYVFNVIPPAHPDPEGLAAWLQRHGFETAQSDGRMLRRRARGH